MLRRTLVALSTASLAAPRLALGQTIPQADGWPARPVRIVVPYPPGGSNDLVARILQPKLQELLGQPIFVENRGGASGSVGAGEVARASPDGSTWLLANDTIATNDTLLQLPYRTMEAFSFCTIVGTCPYALLTGSTAPYRTLAELVDAAKRAPATLSFATTGNGSLAHIAATLLQKRGDFQLVHVPYRGGGPALQDVLGGHVPLFMSNIVIVLPHVRSGALRALGVTSATPSPHMPGIVPFAQQGFPGFEALTYWAMLAPARVPAPIVARMQAAIAQAAADPAIRPRLEEQGVQITTTSPNDTERFIRGEVENWGSVIRENNLRIEG